MSNGSMMRVVGVLGDIKKEIALLRKEVEKTGDKLKHLQRAQEGVEYRGTTTPTDRDSS